MCTMSVPDAIAEVMDFASEHLADTDFVEKLIRLLGSYNGTAHIAHSASVVQELRRLHRKQDLEGIENLFLDFV